MSWIFFSSLVVSANQRTPRVAELTAVLREVRQETELSTPRRAADSLGTIKFAENALKGERVTIYET